MKPQISRAVNHEMSVVQRYFEVIAFSALLLGMFFVTLSSAADDMPDYFVPPPPFSEDIFPCSGCHADMEVNTTRRELDFHEDIVLKHAEEQRWCLDCHNASDRDKLRFASGQLISFEESYYL
jgi:hypothetical protein